MKTTLPCGRTAETVKNFAVFTRKRCPVGRASVDAWPPPHPPHLRPFFADRHSDQGRNRPLPPVCHHPAGLPAPHPLQPHLRQVSRRSIQTVKKKKKAPSCEVSGGVLLLRPPQPRRRRQEEASDHPQSHPGIGGAYDRHSDRELRRKMVCNRSAAAPPPAPHCSPTQPLFAFRPLWLSPRQVMVVPVGPTCDEYAEKVSTINFCFVVQQTIGSRCAQWWFSPQKAFCSLSHV